MKLQQPDVLLVYDRKNGEAVKQDVYKGIKVNISALLKQTKKPHSLVGRSPVGL